MTYTIVAQVFVFLLLVDAGWVAIGLAQKKNMWFWILVYWVLLTAKNMCDFLGMVGL